MQTIARCRPHAPALVTGLVIVALMLLWAVHDGGYDADTWYWGALVVLAIFTGVVWMRRNSLALSRPVVIALGAFALYVVWSYLSIAWAGSQGDALQGSNRALMYLLIFALLAVLPWTTEAALVTLLAFALGVGVIGFVLLARLSSGDNVGKLVIDARLAAPTGYFNSTAALFTIDTLVATALATRRELPPLLRGLLIASACASLQLAVVVQSRGWLFTLPLIAIVAIVIVPDRLRFAAAAALPVLAALASISRLLDVYSGAQSEVTSRPAAGQAGTAAFLWITAAMFIAATALAWVERRTNPPLRYRWGRRRIIGTALVTVAVAGAAVGFCACRDAWRPGGVRQARVDKLQPSDEPLLVPVALPRSRQQPL